MSIQPQEKLKLGATVIASVQKTLVGSRKRMESLADTISVKTGGDAHTILLKSRKRISAAMKEFETEAKAQGVRHKKSSIAIVSLLATAYNQVDSGIDALEEGELTKNDLMEVARDARSVVVQALTLMRSDVEVAGQAEMDDAAKFLIAAERASAAPAKETAAPKSRKEELEDIEEEEEEKRVRKDATQNKHYDSIKHLFEHNRVHLTKLPSSKTSDDPFVILKMPVYPQTASIAGEEQYKAAGLKVGGKAGFYIQLNDQILLGVNTNELDRSKGKDGKKKIAKGALIKRTLEIIKVLSQKRHTTFHVIGSDGRDIDGAGRMAPNNQSPGFVYYWLMDDATLSRLNAVLRRNGHSFDVDDWGMAVPSK